MAFRRPLYYDASGSIKEWKDSHIANTIAQLDSNWNSDSSVILEVASNGTGNMGTMYDTRMQAGAASTSASSTPSTGTTAEPTIVSVGYTKLKQTIITQNVPSYSHPLYYTGEGELREMSLQDIKDTFIYDAITSVVTRPHSGHGTLPYRINTNIISGWTDLGTVFTNTGADVSKYTAAGITETKDQSKLLNDPFKLFKNLSAESYSIPKALCWNNGNIIEQNKTSDLMLQMKHSAVNDPGYRIRYNVNGSGNRTVGMPWDSRLNGSGNYQTRFVNANDYRAQEFPNGSLYTVSTYTVRINKE